MKKRLLKAICYLPAIVLSLNWTRVDAASLNDSLKQIIGIESPDPNKSLGDVASAIISITNWAASLAGVLALIMILYSAFTYVTSYGDESRAETAKKTLLWSIVGMALVIFSKIILIQIYNLLK